MVREPAEVTFLQATRDWSAYWGTSTPAPWVVGKRIENGRTITWTVQDMRNPGVTFEGETLNVAYRKATKYIYATMEKDQ